jgi:hypothetical protein
MFCSLGIDTIFSFSFFNKCINECVTISLNSNKNTLVVKQVSRQLISDWGLMIDKCSIGRILGWESETGLLPWASHKNRWM